MDYAKKLLKFIQEWRRVNKFLKDRQKKQNFYGHYRVGEKLNKNKALEDKSMA